MPGTLKTSISMNSKSLGILWIRKGLKIVKRTLFSTDIHTSQ